MRDRLHEALLKSSTETDVCAVESGGSARGGCQGNTHLEVERVQDLHVLVWDLPVNHVQVALDAVLRARTPFKQGQVQGRTLTPA